MFWKRYLIYMKGLVIILIGMDTKTSGVAYGTSVSHVEGVNKAETLLDKSIKCIDLLGTLSNALDILEDRQIECSVALFGDNKKELVENDTEVSACDKILTRTLEEMTRKITILIRDIERMITLQEGINQRLG